MARCVYGLALVVLCRRLADNWSVLVAGPGESEAQISFAALGDLLSGVLEQVLGELPRQAAASLSESAGGRPHRTR